MEVEDGGGSAFIRVLEEKSRRVRSRSRTRSGRDGRGVFIRWIVVDWVNFWRLLSLAACCIHCT